MTTNRKRGLSILLVGLMVLAAVAVPATAAFTTDTETSTTSGSSDLTSSTTITEPLNDSTQRIQIQGDSNTNTSNLADPGTAMTLDIVVNDSDHVQDGETVYSTDADWSNQSVSAAPDHYYQNITTSDFGSNLAWGATENFTVDARVTFNESESDEVVHNITFTVDPAGDDARVQIGDDDAEVSNKSVLFGLTTVPSWVPGAEETTGAADVTSEDVSVNSNTSEVTVDLTDTEAVDSFAEVTDGVDAATFSGMAWVTVSDQTVPVFVESVSSDDAPSWLEVDDEAYATVNSAGDEITLHNANATFDEDTTSVDLSATGNQDLGWSGTYSLVRDYGGGYTDALGGIDWL